MLRRSPKYRAAVAEFLRSVRARRKHLFKTINSQHLDSHRLSTEQRLELWGRRILGLQEVLTAYESVLKTYSLVKAQRMVASRADRPRGEDSPSVTLIGFEARLLNWYRDAGALLSNSGGLRRVLQNRIFRRLNSPQRDLKPWYRNYSVFRKPGALVFRCRQVFR
jgi:hypothetical protein